MIEDKKKLAGAIVGSDESWLTELDNESFKKANHPKQKCHLGIGQYLKLCLDSQPKIDGRALSRCWSKLILVS